MLKPKPYLLLNCLLGRNIGSWKIPASHSLYIHYVYIGCSYKRKSISQNLREQLQLHPKAQIEDSSNSKWISKTLCFLTFCQGVLLHILLKRNRKPSASRTLGCHLAPLRWANLGGTFQYLYLLPIGKTLTLVLTIFHLWLTCNFLLFFLPGLYYSPPVISLKCPEKNCFLLYCLSTPALSSMSGFPLIFKFPSHLEMTLTPKPYHFSHSNQVFVSTTSCNLADFPYLDVIMQPHTKWKIITSSISICLYTHSSSRPPEISTYNLKMFTKNNFVFISLP